MKARKSVSKALKWSSLLLLLASITTLAYWLFTAYFPASADISLDAKTDRLLLRIRAGGPAFAWNGLEWISADDRTVGCMAQPIQFGSENVEISVTTQAATPSTVNRTSRSADSELVDLAIHVRRDDPGNGSSRAACIGKHVESAQKSLVLVLRGERARIRHLPLYAHLTVGGIVDPQGGPMGLLKEGVVRASARLRGSSHMPVSNQMELSPGDQLEIMPAATGDEAVSVGVAIFDGKDLRVLAHAAGASAVVRRAGLGTPREILLRPGPLAILQSNPLWGVATLVCSIASGLLGMFASRNVETKARPDLTRKVHP